MDSRGQRVPLSDGQLRAMAAEWAALCAGAAGLVLRDEPGASVRVVVRGIFAEIANDAVPPSLGDVVRHARLEGYPPELVCAVLVEMCRIGEVRATPHDGTLQLVWSAPELP